MVFESVITEVLNRFLSDYVENLDSKQLKVGIWGGDVVLNNLILKQTALNDLDLPIQTVYGRLNSLILKIPWTNIYTAAVQAEIDGLYLLVEPNNQIKYDAEKEERQEIDAKKAELQKIDNIKKKLEEADKPPADDGFVEKLTTQIIKNVQVKIRNIHVRYEDKVTNPRHPFAMGLTLSNLALETTNKNWVPTLAGQAVREIYKIMELEGLAVYWNCDATHYFSLSHEEKLNMFQKEIATKEEFPKHYQYILGPINSTAKLIMNPKPHLDTPAFSSAKLQAELKLEKLAIGISKCQYRDVILFADAMQLLEKGVPYRKYRPDVDGYKGHAREWWQFAYSCVLETDVRRVRRNWEWLHIIEHRELCREYSKAYQTKLTSKKLPADAQKSILDMERRLDVFNIVLIRQRIQLEVERLGTLQKEATKSRGWFGGWWGGNATESEKELKSKTDIVKQFQDAMTPDEKARLFKAIDYNQNAGPTIYPDDYVNSVFTFNLDNLVVDVFDDEAAMQSVLSARLVGVKCKVQQREAMKALVVNVNINNLNIFGLDSDDFQPLMVTSSAPEKGDMLSVLFETNPLDKECDQRLHLETNPLKVVYDAITINQVIDVFRVAPESNALDQFAAATAGGISNIREMSASGLEHIINKQPRLDLRLNVHAPYVLVPYGGRYTDVENVLVINFGTLKVNSIPRNTDISLKQIVAREQDTSIALEKVTQASYDRFNIAFTGLQILLAQGGEDWLSALTKNQTSTLHLLHPTEVHVQFAKCLVSDDPKIPLSKVTGKLPSINLNITDVKLLTLLSLVNSIPMPNQRDKENSEDQLLSMAKMSRASMNSLNAIKQRDRVNMVKIVKAAEKPKEDPLVQFTEIELNFVMEEMVISLSRQESGESELLDTLKLSINSLECDFRQQTFNKRVDLRLGNIILEQDSSKKKIKVIDSPVKAGEYLFKVNFIQVNKNSPELHTKYNSCECSLNLEFSSLIILLNQVALTDVVKFAKNLQTQMDEMNESRQTSRASVSYQRRLSTISSVVINAADIGASRHKHKKLDDGTIIFKLTATLCHFSVTLENPAYKICTVAIEGISAEFIQKESQVEISARLLNFIIENLNKQSVYRHIVSVTDKEAINAKIIMYNVKDDDLDTINMSVEATIGHITIVVLNRFISNVLNFFANFQDAQNAIQHAAADAAETARVNMRHAYKNSTKIALKINLNAPIFYIPEATNSLNTLRIDTGFIKISNVFKELEIKNEQNVSAIIEDITLDLSNFGITRLLLDASDAKQTKMTILKSATILEPTSFSVFCQRNLSTSWYKAPPEIDVAAKIVNITLHLSQVDYNMMMNVVQYNFGDSVPNLFRTDVIVRSGKTPTTPQPLISTDSAPLTTIVSITDKDDTVDDTVIPKEERLTHCFIRWSFRMDHFIIDLLSSAALPNVADFDTPKYDLGRFTLVGLSLTGRMLTDNSLTASVLLSNCVIDDTRPNREVTLLNRLFERKPEPEVEKDSVNTLDLSQSSKHTRNMVEVNVQQNRNDLIVDLIVYSITTILSMDFITKVTDFFVPVEPEDMQKPKPVFVSKSNKSNLDVKNRRESIMTITVLIEKPDIILVEHMRDIDTYALILNTEMSLKFRMSGKHQVINATIKDTNLAICCFNPGKRQDTTAAVLYPVTISINGSTPADKGLHIDVICSDVKLSVSPTTIEIVNRIMSAFTQKASKDELSDAELFDFSNMWNMTSYTENDYWFLRQEQFEVAEEALNDLDRPHLATALTELCILHLPSFVVTIEVGVGTKTIPMILVESSLTGRVNNWSSLLALEATLTLQMGYYNSHLALWEPLIEPINVTKGNENTYAPWSIDIEVLKAPVEDAALPLAPIPSSSSFTIDGNLSPEEQLRPATLSIELISRHNLELTVTKSALEVLTNLSKAFSSAMAITQDQKQSRISEILAPYKLVNNTGLEVNVMLDKGDFDLYEGNSRHNEAVLKDNAEVNLQKKSHRRRSIQLKNLLSSCKDEPDTFLHVQIKKLGSELKLPVVRADIRYFPLKYKGDSNDNWGLVSSIIVENGITTVTLCSIILVHNHFNVPIDVYYMTASGNELAMVATVQPKGELHLPLSAVYTPTNEIFLSVNGYSVTTTPFVWKDLQLNLAVTNMLSCAPVDRNSDECPFMIKAVGEIEQIYHEHTVKHTMLSTMYHIHLRPALVLKNCLPVEVILCLQELDKQKTIEPGACLQIPNVDPGNTYIILRLPNYLEKEWSCRRDIVVNPPQFTVWTFDSHDSVVKMSLDLGMQNFNKGGSTIMSLYCPFWMLNKTGLLLSYRKSKKTEKNEAAGTPSKADENLNIIHHPVKYNFPILFSFNAKNFFGKKKASIRIDQGDWSDKFSLDVAGSSGVVSCKSNNIIYQIGVSNKLTYNGLSKQVTFTPYYVLINNAPFDIEVQELARPADPWTRVNSKACTPLWASSDSDDKLIIARVVDTNDVSAPFFITESHTTLLKLKNKYGGINVDIQLTEGAVYINMTSYERGMAPVLIINNTEHTMNLWEKESVQLRKLDPKHSFLYTWENPSGPRVIMWEGGFKAELEDDVRKDDVGDYMISDTEKVFWVSFLDGMQRILLFTSNEAVAENAQSAKKFEIVEQEITLSLYGVGISLTNNIVRKEIMYMALASTGIIWEYCKSSSKRFKPFSHKENVLLEGAFQQFSIQNILSTNTLAGNYMVDSKTEVDFLKNIMLKPHKRAIRRTFQTGLWIQMKTSPNQMQLHAKVNRVQIDNQLYDCIFPVVLAPVPPPKSVGESGVHKPFIELSIVELLMKHSQIKQFKYFKVLIQEFHIKVDLGFVNAIMEILNTAESTEAEDMQSFIGDIAFAQDKLYNHVSMQYIQDQKNFYDLLHFSPLKIHISFSMAATGSSGSSSNTVTPNFVNVILQGLGVTLTDLQDVIFKLGYFERDYTFLSMKQLTSETTSHYVGQLVKQLYVLVFGLDVLGNPYGLVIGITKGVEDFFYEPFQGAIQGPGEFAEGLVLGVRSLFGHTVGGAAGAVSRITGAMGKGIAALTFDKDYQRKRRDQINKKPESVQEGFARGGKGLVMGVVDGVTGVFTKPVSGAKEEGIEGFFKGVGKGAIGLLTRPTAGVVDFASSSMDTVKRVTEVGHAEFTRIRPTRFIAPDGLVRPFNFKESEGHKLLNELEKGKYSTTDVYSYHLVIIERKEVMLLTDKRVAYITYSELFGGWQIDWSYTWSEMKTPPKIVPKGILLSTEGKKKKMSFFGSADLGKTLLITDPDVCVDVCARIEELQKKA